MLGLSPSRAFLLAVVCALAVASCGRSVGHPPGGEESDLELPDDPQPLPANPSADGALRVQTGTPEGTYAFVHHVEDGDSVVVEIADSIKTVRLIGINAPEQGECLADNARNHLADLLQDTAVILESDVEDEDQFGRLLRYVWLDGELINEIMVARGLAIAREFQPNLARQATLKAAQSAARQSGLGVWASDACGPVGTIEIAILAIQSDPAGPDAENLNGEFVIFENLSDSIADLSGFGLRDGSSSNRYSFPDGTRVEGGARFVVYVGCGADSAVEYYWCHDGPVWNNDGDEAILTDRSGNIVAYDSY